MKKAVMVLMLSAIVFLTVFSSPADAQDRPTPKGQAEGAVQDGQYIIGPEDVLLIYVWKEDALTKTIPVRMDGKISLPLADDIEAAGLTPLQLKEVITQKLQTFIDSPTVTVTVMEANSYKAYVTGEVKNPGVHKINGEMTLLKLIPLVGGFTEWADQKKILVVTKENGAEKRRIVNYKKIIEGEEPDIPIHRGDTVVVR